VGAANVTAHEFCHYWMHVGTPYGFVLDELADLQVAAASLYCARIHSSEQRIPIPAVEVAWAFQEDRLDVNRFAEFHELSVELTIPWTHDALLEQWLEGTDHGAVRASRLPKLLRWLIDFEARSAAAHPDQGLFSAPPGERSEYQSQFVLTWAEFAEKAKVPPFPTIGPEHGVKRPLGARHIFEACAVHVETQDSFWSSAAAGLLTEYWSLFAGFASCYPAKIDSSYHMGRVLTTFMALADLALSTPIGGVYSRLRTDNMTWRDLHPGWRFERLMRRLDFNDWIEDIGDGPKLQSLLSSRLGWPHPARFLSLGAALAASSGAATRHARACQLRLEADDRLIVSPGIDWTRIEPFVAEHSPIQIRGDESAVPGETVQRKLSLLFGYALPRFAWMTMRGGIIDWPALLPRGLDLASVFTNISSRDELLAMMHGVPPLYPDDAFCRTADFLAEAALVDVDS
jgi:hypothetical protein